MTKSKLKTFNCFLPKNNNYYYGVRGLRNDKITVTIIHSSGESTLSPRRGSFVERRGRDKIPPRNWVERMAFRHRFKVVERSFLWKLTYYLCIKWLTTNLSTALIRKWPLNSRFTAKQFFLLPSTGI